MLQIISALNGYAVAASDGRMGSVSDFLFDDENWKIRWLVVDTGTWLWQSGRKVLIPPPSIGPMDHTNRNLSVLLTKKQVLGSPDILENQPVSRQRQNHLNDYYGSDPSWGGVRFFAARADVSPLNPAHDPNDVEARTDDGDPHLRSLAAVRSYHVHATDGELGHVEDFLVESADWSVRYLIVDTGTWWPGQHVLVSPYAVREVRWSRKQVRLDLTRDRVKASPPWQPAEAADPGYERRLHDHYGWPGYGF